jgi:hypothetical protein
MEVLMDSSSIRPGQSAVQYTPPAKEQVDAKAQEIQAKRAVAQETNEGLAAEVSLKDAREGTIAIA